MKKILFVLLIILLGLGVYVYSQKSQSRGIQDFLPGNPVAYYESSSVKRQWDAIPMLNGIRRQIKHFIGDTRTFDRIFDIMFRKIFTKDVAIALYRDPLVVTNTNKREESLRDLVLKYDFLNIIFIGRISKSVQSLEPLVNRISNISQKLSVYKKIYNGVGYNVVNFNEKDVSVVYVRFDDVIVISNTEGGILSTIDTYLGRVENLSMDRLFQKSRIKFSRENFFFLRLAYLYDFFKNRLDIGLRNRSYSQWFDKIDMSNFQGYRFYSLNVSDLPKVNMNAVIGYDDKTLQKGQLNYYKTCMNSKNESLDYVPKSALMYQWVGCLDWKFYMKYVLPEFLDSRAKEKEAQLELWKPYMDVLGDQLGWFVSDLKETSVLPIPELIVFVKIRNMEGAKRLIRSFLDKRLLKTRRVHYKKAVIYQFQYPLVLGLQLGYAFVGDYVFFTTDIESLKRSLDMGLGEGGDSFRSNDVFRFLGGDGDAGNFIMHVNWMDIVDKVSPYIKENHTVRARKYDVANHIMRRKKERVRMVNEKKGLENDIALGGMNIAFKKERLLFIEEKLYVLDQDLQLTYDPVKFLDKINILRKISKRVDSISIRSIIKNESVEINGFFHLQ